MQTKTSYEEEILKEIGSLPEDMQKKIAKFIYLLKSEFMEEKLDEKKAAEELLSICGRWEDERSAKRQIKDIYSNRRSTFRTEKIF